MGNNRIQDGPSLINLREAFQDSEPLLVLGLSRCGDVVVVVGVAVVVVAFVC
jgi:hypothetical protein